MSIYAFIPARLDSSRFDRKVLFNLEGKTILQRVFEGSYSEKIDDIFITTCDEEIAAHSRDFGAKVIMTSKSHVRCLDRVAEAYSKLTNKSMKDTIFCIQGDEPLIDSNFVDYFINKQIEKKYDFSVAAVNIHTIEEFKDPDIVKIIWNETNKMIYTSRNPIPYLKIFRKDLAWKIFGMFGFSPQGLKSFNEMNSTFLERIEECDTNRICGSDKLSQFVIPYKTTKQYQAVDNVSNLKRVKEILDSK